MSDSHAVMDDLTIAPRAAEALPLEQSEPREAVVARCGIQTPPCTGDLKVGPMPLLREGREENSKTMRPRLTPAQGTSRQDVGDRQPREDVKPPPWTGCSRQLPRTDHDAVHGQLAVSGEASGALARTAYLAHAGSAS